MVESFTTVPPFYEAEPTPPLPLPLLMAQTDPLYCIPRNTLLVQEAYRSGNHCIRHARRIDHPSTHPYHHTARAQTPGVTARAWTPGMVARACTPGTKDDADGEPGRKIPKPPGEVGRPGRGGYNLEHAMQWSPENLEKLKVCRYPQLFTLFKNWQQLVHRLVSECLDESQCYSNQKLELINAVCDAVGQLPFLNSYSLVSSRCFVNFLSSISMPTLGRSWI
jgi:hypothetical protein